MTDFSCAYPDPGAVSDLDQLYDEDDEDASSTTSILADDEELNIETRQCLKEQPTALKHHSRFERIVRKTFSPPSNSTEPESKASLVSRTHPDPVPVEEIKPVKRRTLNLLDLPVDILQEIIKLVIHTNDLTSLALTCSALHSLAIPQMYSRFDIVWPDAVPNSGHSTGVDALSYGLATLVTAEDIFREVPLSSVPSPCSHCGCNSRMPYLQRSEANGRPIRRGNYFAQYTRKFSIGNGPSDWVQEYSVTKETGKMLGTLVALAVARMVNLETFIWDMPTGVVREVWIALASLADRPGHDCRLENVWIRWHDNSENKPRSPPAAPTASSLALPETQTMVPSYISSALFGKYRHVEYPSLSILPPLKSLSVLDIDETSYLEEMAVLIERSRHCLRELRIGLSAKAYKQGWWKPRDISHTANHTIFPAVPGWPKPGGVLGVALGWHDYHAHGSRLRPEGPIQVEHGKEPETVLQAGASTPADTVETPSSSLNDSAPFQNFLDAQLSTEQNTNTSSHSQNTCLVGALDSETSRENSKGFTQASPSKPGSDRQLLRLESLELERVSISPSVLLDSLDWTRIKNLTILRCDGHEKLWRGLRRRFAPTSPRTGFINGRKGGPGPDKDLDYPLKVKHLHTDAVSPYMLLFIKDTLRPNTLETVFLHGPPIHDSAVEIEGIYRNIIRTHRSSLRKLLVDGTGRAPGGAEISTARCRKWTFNREMITFMTSGRMSKLNELSMALDFNNWVGSLTHDLLSLLTHNLALLPAKASLYFSTPSTPYSSHHQSEPNST
ncbi:hypothetical protein ASPCAL06588 [Aspergillus calidoustus]|uniref:Uncharacterized protein n=1 Tax=Aspergillus calidoustus TaxID=454130 RepID=A0A0U5G4J6_ASPCI|nr:hypothetical protein ASPCAL06588 [Aspergillus calidoustus]